MIWPDTQNVEEFEIVAKDRVVFIRGEPLELYKLLKMENLTGSGGEAKHAIAEGLVRVNGEVETRKRRKVFAGDRIEFLDQRIKVSVET